MSTDDKRIREFAYQIWESEGKPEGCLLYTSDAADE